jgi:DNA-directed RNA polymerase subunit RPC12/RpoP
MATAENADNFVCSFCEQTLRISSSHIGRRFQCPKCGRRLLVFPNSTGSIDHRLSSTWFYRKMRHFRTDKEVGPITDEDFIRLVQSGIIDSETAVSSPEFTANRWVSAGSVDFQGVKNLFDQRQAERKRVAAREQRRNEAAQVNRSRLFDAIRTAVSDGTITVGERAQLFQFAHKAGIPALEVETTIAQEGRRLLDAVIGDAIEDGILEPEEKHRIFELAKGLGLVEGPTRQQLDRLELCELAWKLANRTYIPTGLASYDFKLSGDEAPLAECRAEWLEIVQAKRPAGIAVGNGHYLKPVARGVCLITAKRVLLSSEFNVKKLPISSVEQARSYRDGLFLKRSTGKSVFLRPWEPGISWRRFALIAEHSVRQEPVLGQEPVYSFIPGDTDWPTLQTQKASYSGTDTATRKTASPSPGSPFAPHAVTSWSQEDLTPPEPRFTFRVVGEHIGDRAAWISRLATGDRVFLVREPANPYDRNAVMVMDKSRHQLGYLKREVADWFAPMLDAGRRFTCSALRLTDYGGLIVGVYET